MVGPAITLSSSLEPSWFRSIFRFVGNDIKFAAAVSNPKVFFLGSEFLGVVEPVRKELTTVEHFICVGDKVGAGMLDYSELASYDDTSEALVEVEAEADLAMMFTSGTTGKPKPVLHTHLLPESYRDR